MAAHEKLQPSPFKTLNPVYPHRYEPSPVNLVWIDIQMFRLRGKAHAPVFADTCFGGGDIGASGGQHVGDVGGESDRIRSGVIAGD